MSEKPKPIRPGKYCHLPILREPPRAIILDLPGLRRKKAGLAPYRDLR